MIVHRFMSDREYQKLIKGDTLKNSIVHKEKGCLSTSIGFCFFTEPPEKAIHWLSFNVDTDWCVTFDIPDEMLTEAKAHYRDPEKDKDRSLFDEPASIWRTEWCLQEYSNKDVQIVKADNQWANYVDEIKKELEKQGPFGRMILALLS